MNTVSHTLLRFSNRKVPHIVFFLLLAAALLAAQVGLAGVIPAIQYYLAIPAFLAASLAYEDVRIFGLVFLPFYFLIPAILACLISGQDPLLRSAARAASGAIAVLSGLLWLAIIPMFAAGGWRLKPAPLGIMLLLLLMNAFLCWCALRAPPGRAAGVWLLCWMLLAVTPPAFLFG